MSQGQQSTIGFEVSVFAPLLIDIWLRYVSLWTQFPTLSTVPNVVFAATVSVPCLLSIVCHDPLTSFERRASTGRLRPGHT